MRMVVTPGRDALGCDALVKEGPLIWVELTPKDPPWRRSEPPAGYPTGPFRALIDPGSASNLIDEDVSIALRLGRSSTSWERITVTEVGASTRAYPHEGQLRIPELGFTKVCEIYSIPGLHPGAERPFSIVLGRDFLSVVEFEYDGPAGSFALTYQDASRRRRRRSWRRRLLERFGFGGR